MTAELYMEVKQICTNRKAPNHGIPKVFGHVPTTMVKLCFLDKLLFLEDYHVNSITYESRNHLVEYIKSKKDTVMLSETAEK